uniref:dolichyl-phosphate-mannose--protein mannosyltransferase n=1 Tax=Esox lucius TaxID=8010 RepID=A0AAY5JZH3_ESOLU
MAQTEVDWDHHIPLPKLAPVKAKITLALVALLCFINSYDGDFVFDDSEAIVNNQDLNPATPLNNIWGNDFWGSNLSSNNSHKSYRPLTVLTFRFNYLMAGGLHPVGFHILNIGLHSLISALMFDMFSILLGGLTYVNRKRLNHVPKASLLAGILFAAHPIHTESVAGIVGRADLLCALFFQLSFLTYCKAFRGGTERENIAIHWIAVSLLLCSAAMLCKEQGITVLGVNAAFDVLLICNVNVFELSHRLFLKKKTADVSELVRTGLLTRLALLSLSGASLLYTRWKIMGTGPPAFTEVDNPASFAENVFLRIVNYNYYYSLNAWLLLCPWWLCFDWSMGCVPLIKSAFDWRMPWLLLLWSFLIGLINQAICSQDSQRRRTLTLGLVLLVVPFLPACNIFFRVGFVVAERVLYLSSAGYCMLLAYALGCCCCRWSKHKVHYNVGKNLADRGNTSAAIKYYREAVRLHPTYVHAMNNLGNILKERNELVEAEDLLAKAVHIQPDFAAAWMNLGIVQNSLRKFEEAEQSYWNAIRFRKKYPDCYYNLGRLYVDLNRHLDALNAWRNATMLKPDHSLAWNNMVILLDNTGNLAQAEVIGREALKLLPKDHTIMFSLANVLGKLQKYEESEGFFLHALRINPNSASCHGNLAVLYHRWGKLELAKKHYELSLKLDPEALGTRDNYDMLQRKLDQLYRTTAP